MGFQPPMILLPRLYAILDTESLQQRNLDPVRAAEAMLDGGARLLQFRHKGTFTRAAYDQASAVAVLCRHAGAQFVVDDRADIAALLDTGLHIGQDDLPPALARRIVGPDRMLGFSTHNAGQLAAAATEPVDYLAFGPMFATFSKQNPDPVVGLAHLQRLRAVCLKPLVAIGGITRANCRQVLEAGADSVAVIADLLPEPCTYESVRSRMEEWQTALTS